MPPEYSAWAILLASVFGLALGSFLNVCIYRIPRDLSVVAPRSFCPECGAQLTWRENIPLLSYIVQGGRCRSCHSAIGKRYPVVELTTALVFAFVVWRYGLTPATFKWLVFEALLIILFFTDLEERILPDEFTLGGAVAGLVFAAFVKTPGVMVDVIASGASARTQSYLASVLGAVALCCPVWLIAVAYEHLRKREGLGLGDVKLLLMMGIFLGFEEGLKAFLWSAVTGAVIGLAYALIRRRKIAELEMPFGSFLCAGAGLVPLLHRITS